jgi:hypothetical protein
MNITGKVVKKFDIQEGITKQGTKWTKQEILIAQTDSYNSEVVIAGITEKSIISISKLKEGDDVSISVNVNSREYNGKYYTNLTGWWWVVLDKTGGEKDMPGFEGTLEALEGLTIKKSDNDFVF